MTKVLRARACVSASWQLHLMLLQPPDTFALRSHCAFALAFAFCPKRGSGQRCRSCLASNGPPVSPRPLHLPTKRTPSCQKQRV